MRVLLIGLLLLTPTAFGQRIHTYTSDEGVRVFTNTPSHAHFPEPGADLAAASPLKDRAKEFGPIIHRVSETYGLERNLIEAIIAVESNFDPEAVSSKNCKGLMQLHPDTAARFGVRDIFDPEENVEGGVRYLQFLLEQFQGNLELALAAYNAGENAVKKFNDIPPYAETQDYVRKVAAIYDLSSFQGALSNRSPVPRRRVYRISLPDGGILFTNTPGEPGR